MTLLNMLNFLPYDVDELHELLALFRVFPGDARAGAGAAAQAGRSGKSRQQALTGGLGTWQPVPGRAFEVGGETPVRANELPPTHLLATAHQPPRMYSVPPAQHHPPPRVKQTSPAYDRSANLKLIKDRYVRGFGQIGRGEVYEQEEDGRGQRALRWPTPHPLIRN